MRPFAWFKNVKNIALVLAIVVFGATAAYAFLHSSTLSPHLSSNKVPSPTLPHTTLLASPQAATSSSTLPSATTTKPAVAASSSNSVLQKVATSTQNTPLAPSSSTVAARQLTASGGALLHSLVNIVCLSSDRSIPSISGTGVIVDSRGIILTAAHVAQFFLLQNYLGSNRVECLIRTGSPARRAYTAAAVYVSPSWIAENPATLRMSSPKGTGQNDFAFLAITGTATSTPLASSFPAIPLSQGDPQANEAVAIGSYGAQYLTSSELNYSLYPILVFGTIQNRYTFQKNTVDLVSVQGSAASQEGSSGGGMVNAAGELIGTITTSSISGDISTRALNAITIDHMRRSYFADTGNDLDSTLRTESLATLISNFKAKGDLLAALLAQGL
ncbi:trypsin-like peptidase domain-containing protein [Patescibacteria group bacterium]|nr:trypsin-like peptidase domain-containing protein [Patescibacteria group bacterium]